MAGVGQMRTKATFMKNEPVQAGAGKKDNYVELFTVYGQLKKRIGSRRLEAGELVIVSTHEYKCRFAEALEEGLDNAAKAVINNKEYTVNGWHKEDERNFYYLFQLNEKK